MLSRRELIGKGAVGAAVTAVALGAVTAVAAPSRRESRTASLPAHDGDGQDTPSAPPADLAPIAAPPPWGLVSPLAAGAELAHGWRLAELGPVRDGSCVVTLQNARGRARRVHLCRNDGTPRGIVYTRRVDFVVMNEGQGDLPTEEPLAQAVAALAHVIAANEGTVPAGLFTDLLPHAERVERFAAAAGRYADGKLR
jgi:hypothetical protein